MQKYSRQRESIRENLQKRTDHPTADMIYSDIRRIYPNISLGTVYRNLALLSDQREIAKITTTDGSLRYDRTVKPHSHFLCKSCGNVTDLSLVDADRIKEQAQVEYLGRIEECEITFYGYCENCLQSEKQNIERKDGN